MFDHSDDKKLPQDVDLRDNENVPSDDDPDAEFGGHEQRKIMEKKLVRKLDLRMSILVIIYILNYVSFSPMVMRL
jgi:hypothetical protein